MLIRISREQTVAIATLSLVLASSLFVIGAAFGEPAKQEALNTAALRAATTAEKSGPQANRVATPSEPKAAAKDVPPTILDLSVVYPPEVKNPTDDPLALFNTPIP